MKNRAFMRRRCPWRLCVFASLREMFLAAVRDRARLLRLGLGSSLWLLPASFLSVLFFPTPGSAQPIPVSIEIGATTPGELTEDDASEPHRDQLADYFVLEGVAGQRLEILLTSDVVDNYLLLEGPAGELLAQDDDSAGYYDARILVTLPLDGTYTVIASSYDSQYGPYEILVREYQTVPVIFDPLVLDEPRQGALTDTDATRSDLRFVDGFRFEGTVGQRVRLRVESESFDTMLIVVAPTGEVIAQNDDRAIDDPNSELNLQLPYDGTYDLLVTSFSVAEGDYTIWAEPVGLRPIEDLAIELGVPTEGTLTREDGVWPVRDTYADGYRFPGTQGQFVEVTLESETFDAFVVLVGPDNMLVGQNDDSDGTLNSRLTARLPADGTYRVLATSQRLTEGVYNLLVREQELRGIDVVSIGVGDTLDGVLSDDDPLRVSGDAHFDVYEVWLACGETVVITMRSDEVNSYLWVTAPSGELLAEDDNSAGGLDAVVEVAAPFDGEYLLGASSPTHGAGAYTLTVDSAGSIQAAAEQTPVQIGESLVGRLERTDGRFLATDAYLDTYTFEGTAGQHIEIRMDSEAVDPVLLLISPTQGLLEEDDDSGGGVASRIQIELPEDGVYRLLATSFRRAVGDYTLEVSAYRPAPIRPTSLGPGRPLSGELTHEDTRSARYGTLLDVYVLDGHQGEQVRLGLSSTELDTFLVIIDPNGETLVEDDNSGDGLNARIELTLPMTGRYRVIATSGSYATGSYDISLESGPPVGEPPIFQTP